MWHLCLIEKIPYSKRRFGGNVRWPNWIPSLELSLSRAFPVFSGYNHPIGIHRETRHSTTLVPSVNVRPRRLAPVHLRIAKSHFEEMLRNNTARCCDSLWASPFHFVPKNEDGWRPCGDYCSPNATTVPYQYPVRHIADFAQLADRQVFSTIDLVKAYHQIPVIWTSQKQV